MTRNQAARKRAEDAPVALIEYAAGEGSAELTARLRTWPTPGIVPGEIAALLREDGREVTAEEAAAAAQWEAMSAAEQEKLRAAADRDRAHAETNQTPAWRATLVSDHLWQWRSRDSLRRLGLKGTDEEIAMSFIDIATTLPDSSTSTTGLSLLTTVIETIPRQITDRHLLVTTVPERTSRIPLAVARTPGVVAVVGNAVIEAVAVDGEPLVTVQPGVLSQRRYRVAPVAQGELFGGPKTLDRHAVGGALLGAVATAPLSGDAAERAQQQREQAHLPVHLSYQLLGAAHVHIKGRGLAAEVVDDLARRHDMVRARGDARREVADLGAEEHPLCGGDRNDDRVVRTVRRADGRRGRPCPPWRAVRGRGAAWPRPAGRDRPAAARRFPTPAGALPSSTSPSYRMPR